MRSRVDLHQVFFGKPSDPDYPRRLTPYDMERLARAERAMVIGEALAEGILWLARLPQHIARLFRRTRGGALAGRRA